MHTRTYVRVYASHTFQQRGNGGGGEASGRAALRQHEQVQQRPLQREPRRLLPPGAAQPAEQRDRHPQQPLSNCRCA